MRSRRGGGCCCAVVGCRNTSVNSKGVHFYKFPKAPHLKLRRQKWIDSMQRINPDGSTWIPTANSRVCSQHFVGNAKSEHPLSPSYDPTIFPDSYKKSVISTNISVQRETSCSQSTKEYFHKRHNSVAAIVSSQSTSEDQESAGSRAKKPCLSKGRVTENNTSNESTTSSNSHWDVKSIATTVTSDTSSQESQENLIQNVFGTNSQVLSSNQFVSMLNSKLKINTKLSKKFDKACGTDIQFQDKFISENYYIHSSFSLEYSSVLHGISSITSDKEMLNIAGVTLNIYKLLLQIINGSNNSDVSNEKHLLIFLVKMKTGVTFSMLAILFSMPQKMVSQIFYYTLRTMARACKKLVNWPSRETIRVTMPQTLRQTSYKDCRVVIDYREIRIDEPNKIEKRGKFYSIYKKEYTIKFLIGCTPNGKISFVSNCYGGSATDAQILNYSGFLELLEPGDMIFADKNYPEIKNTLMNNERGIILLMPPFLQNCFISSDEILETYKFARAQIHIKKILQRLRSYKILNKFTVDMLPYCDDILLMSGVLTNLQPPIH